MSIDEIRAAALELERADRASLAHDLLLSLDDEGAEDGWEEAWGAEIERRYNQYLRGEAVLIDGEESIRRAREALQTARRERRS
ncbi:MAG: addiction module protein [Planctomycetaceae bacterium]|nr:addiction module protein [Planctomycetaceae bacterium]